MAEDTLLGAGDARQLLQRTGFGALPKEVARYAAHTRGEVVDRLLGFSKKPFKPKLDTIEDLAASWFRYMLQAAPLQEKLVLFWHDHFATDYNKVRGIPPMARQNALFRSYCKGNFKEFVKAVNRDDLCAWLTNGGDASTVVVRDYAVTYRILDMIVLVMQSAAYQLH